MARPPHQLADDRSLALHREVARRLRADPALVARARARVDGWLASGAVARPYADAWAEALRRPLEELLALITDPGEHARALRQVSPFAGVIDPRTRWQILRATRAAARP